MRFTIYDSAPRGASWTAAVLCRFLVLWVLWFCGPAQAASTVISATLTITNHTALTNATSGQSYTLNSDTRTFTNSVANAATQIRVRTNDSASTILLSLVGQAGSYPFTGIPSITISAGTNATFRASNDTALTITLTPTNWGKVTYTTQTVGTVQTVIRVPQSAEASGVATNLMSLLWDDLDTYSQDRGLGRVDFSDRISVAGRSEFGGRMELDAGFGLHGRYLVATNYTLTTNEIYTGVDTRSNTNLILTLPSASSASNLLFIIKDEGGAGATNTIKIYPASGDRIDTILTNLVVSNNYGGVILRSSGGTNYAILTSGGGVSGSFAGGGIPGVYQTNSVWVAKNGSDSTGARGDSSKPFLTLGAAKTAASSGDTIFVMPGTYDERNLLKNGVNWNFSLGAKVIYTGTANGGIFDDTSDGANAAVTSSITGQGEFDNQNPNEYYVLYIDNNSTIRFQGLSATSLDYVVSVGNLGPSTNQHVTIEDMTITGVNRNPILFNNADGFLTLNRCKLVMNDTDNNGSDLFIFAANTNSVIRDCVFVGNASAGSPVSIKSQNAGTQIRIYGSLTSNLTNDTTNVSIIVGENRFEVDTDVQ